MNRYTTTLLAASAVLVASVAAASAAVSTAHLNVRSGPGVQFPVIGQLAPGQPVNVGPCSGGWCAADGGYVSQRYLAFDAAPPPAVVYDDYAYGYDYYDPYLYAAPTIGFWYGTGPRFYRDRYRGRHVHRDRRGPRAGQRDRGPRYGTRSGGQRSGMRSGGSRTGAYSRGGRGGRS
jgi:uncharacterized protein YraI